MAVWVRPLEGKCDVCNRTMGRLHRVFSNSGRKYWVCNKCDHETDPKAVLDKLQAKENCEAMLNTMAGCLAVVLAGVVAVGLLFMMLGMVVACCWGSPPWYGSSL